MGETLQNDPNYPTNNFTDRSDNIFFAEKSPRPTLQALERKNEVDSLTYKIGPNRKELP